MPKKDTLARFRIKSNFGPYGDGPEKSIEIVVYKRIKDMRKAAAEYSGCDISEMKQVLGVCHRFNTTKYAKDGTATVKPFSAIIRLCNRHCGIGVLTHEITHACVSIAEHHRGPDNLPTSDDDEDMAWIMGDFVRLAALKMYEHGVWK